MGVLLKILGSAERKEKPKSRSKGRSCMKIERGSALLAFSGWFWRPRRLWPPIRVVRKPPLPKVVVNTENENQPQTSTVSTVYIYHKVDFSELKHTRSPTEPSPERAPSPNPSPAEEHIKEVFRTELSVEPSPTTEWTCGEA